MTNTHTSQLLDEQLAQELASLLGSENVSTRAIDRHGIAHDASHYLVIPQAVVTPTNTEQIAALLRSCSRSGTPLTFRSGGTSLSGQAQSESILADTRRGFKGIEVLDEGRRVRVKPGSTVRLVNAHLRRHGYRLGPDPASESACTVGGVVANNSSGMQCGTTENTYATLESMVLVLPSGTVVDSSMPGASATLAREEPQIFEGIRRLHRRIHDNPASLRILRQQYMLKNTMGYGLNAFVDFEDPLDILVHLMIGSEGTLGFIAEATFRTVPLAPYQATGLLVFPDLESATDAVPGLLETGTATAELLDAASLRVSAVLDGAPEDISNLRVTTHAALLVEYQAADPEELDERVHAARPVLERLRLDTPHRLTTDAAERASLWNTRKGLYSAVAWARPSGTNALLEDIAVPVARLAHTCSELSDLFTRYGYEDSVIFGHARDGNVHFLVNERFDDDAALTRYQQFTESFVDLVLSENGTLKAEHGTGRVMAPFVRRQFGDELYEVMQEVKRLIDPTSILNPRTLLSDDSTSYLRDLKTAPKVEAEVDRCVECGYCEPVCPSRDLTTTPRQRIVLRREIAAAQERGEHALVEVLRRDYEYDAVDTCAVDGMCAASCPVGINTGDLVRRLRTENSRVLADGLWNAAAGSWRAVTRSGAGALSLAKRVPAPLPTAATKLGRALLGAENIPLYDRRLPTGGRARHDINNPTARAVAFPSCVGSMFGSERGGLGAGAAFLTLCERAGLEIRTPPKMGRLCCGMPWSSKGHARGHQRMREEVLEALREATEDGLLPVVVDSTSCTQGLGELVSGAEFTHPVSVVDATSFVASRVLPHLRATSRLESLLLHPTCSSTQLGLNDAIRTCAEFISDEVVEPVEWGCCAFAGDRGLLHPELTASATAAEAAWVNQREYSAYASANRTCELGMTRATGRPYENILELLERHTRR